MINQIENNVEKPVAQVIFAHGAGADMSHEFMTKITVLLNRANINVLRFNFPYMDKRLETGKRYPPNRMPILIDCFKTVFNDYVEQRGKQSNLPLLIGGKSMGARVAATLANDEELASLIQGVFCLGYPFHPPKKPENLRLAPLQDTKNPMLIVQGERDTLGSQAEIGDYQLSSLCQCIFLPDGDHSLKPRVKSGFTYQQHRQSAVDNIVDFIQSLIVAE